VSLDSSSISPPLGRSCTIVQVQLSYSSRYFP
jgi:hypothetical protein